MTKSSLCLIALALIICCSHAQTADGYTDVPPSQYNDPTIQKFLNYGFDKVYLHAVSSGKLSPNYSASNFTVTKIYSIQTQVVSGENYKYNLTLTSTDSAVTINANYIVYNQAWTNITRVSSLHYQVYNNKVAGGYEAIPESEYNNTNIQELMEFGIKNIISLAYKSKKINSTYEVSSFTVSKINSIKEQIVNGVNYKYDIVLDSNDNEVTITAVFVVYNQAWSNRTNFVSWSYLVTINTTPSVDGGYTVVPSSEYNNADIQEFMQYGIENIVGQAIKAKKISSKHNADSFTVAQINGIWEQIVSGINYKYKLVLKSTDKKVTITTTFVVFNQEWTNTTDMDSSSYLVINN